MSANITNNIPYEYHLFQNLTLIYLSSQNCFYLPFIISEFNLTCNTEGKGKKKTLHTFTPILVLLMPRKPSKSNISEALRPLRDIAGRILRVPSNTMHRRFTKHKSNSSDSKDEESIPSMSQPFPPFLPKEEANTEAKPEAKGKAKPEAQVEAKVEAKKEPKRVRFALEDDKPEHESSLSQRMRLGFPGRRQREAQAGPLPRGLSINRSLGPAHPNSVVNSLTGAWADLTKKCVVCLRPGCQPCVGCFDTYYCSEFCRNMNREMHQVFCGAGRWMMRRPGSMYYLGFFLDVGSDKPQMVWLKQSQDTDQCTIVIPPNPSLTPDSITSDSSSDTEENDNEEEGTQNRHVASHGDEEQPMPAQDSPDEPDGRNEQDEQDTNTDLGQSEDTVENDGDEEVKPRKARKAKFDRIMERVVEKTDWMEYGLDTSTLYTSKRTVTLRRSLKYGGDKFSDGRVIDIFDVPGSKSSKSSTDISSNLRLSLTIATKTNFLGKTGPVIITGRYIPPDTPLAATGPGSEERVETESRMGADGNLIGQMRDLNFSDFKHVCDFLHLAPQYSKRERAARERGQAYQFEYASRSTVSEARLTISTR